MVNTVTKTLLLGLCLLPQAFPDALSNMVEQALNHHPEVLASLAQQQAAHAAIKEAQSAFLPSVDITYGHGRERTRTPSRSTYETLGRTERRIEIKQPLFDLSLPYELDAKERQYKAAYFAYLEQKQITTAQSLETYLNVLRSKKLVKLASENVDLHKNTLRKISRKYQRGAGDKSDVELAESRLSAAESVLLEVNELRANSISAFRRAHGRLPGNLPALHMPSTAHLPASLEQAIQTAMLESPILKKHYFEYLSAKQEKMASQARGFWPTLELDLSGNRNGNLDGTAGPNIDMQGMLMLRWNVYHGGRDQAVWQTATSVATEQKMRFETVRRETIQKVSNAFHTFVFAKKRFRELQKREKTAKEVAVAYRKQFTLGKRSLLNLLDGEREWFQAKNELTNSHFDLILSVYELKIAMGHMALGA